MLYLSPYFLDTREERKKMKERANNCANSMLLKKMLKLTFPYV